MSLQPATAAALDGHSADLPRSLRTPGPARDEAIACLHGLLLQATRFEVARRGPGSQLRGDELEEIAREAAADAVTHALRRLDDFGGASRFSTWASKFAVHEAAVQLRKHAWQGRELPAEPDEAVDRRELPSALRAAIAEALTPEQRRVLMAVALNGVPIDVLAERLNTTRGTLYEVLSDARRELREAVGRRGLTVA